MNAQSPSTSRREVVKYAAGLGLLAPFALGSHGAAAQEETVDYSGHPGVGVWIEGSGPTYAYQIAHADGTLFYYNPWTWAFVRAGADADPKLPVFGFGVWKPTGDRTTEGILRIAWGDTEAQTFMTLKGRSTVSEDGNNASGIYKERIIDQKGNITEGSGTSSAKRLQWEPYDEEGLVEGTPESQ